ncbi:MAG: substrate-binding domain-containing protein [Oscillospiraceae bacterium]|nr:substrate-binding domain-containing protein [Oscillospiraceae bacterium]
MKRFVSVIVSIVLVMSLVACGGSTDRPMGWYEYGGAGGIEAASITVTCDTWGDRALPELPIIDGSSSTVVMHAAIRAFLTDEHIVKNHSQTYAALERLIPGNDNPADMLLAVSYHEETLQDATERGADLIITPIAREGFIFILHNSNPIDSLTVEQIRDIYTGRITNWNQVGGNNEDIVPFVRNWDSGSQTAMEDFMAQEPFSGIGDLTMLTSMGAMLYGVQEVGSAGIGYNIFSWSGLQDLDQMGLKTLAINGVKPSNDALSDGSYPLMVYTFSFYNRGNEKAEILTQWLLSQQGQQVLASAGYVGVNGQLPPDIVPDFDRDEFFSSRAVIEYYHTLPDSRIVRTNYRQGNRRIVETHIHFEDGIERTFIGSYYRIDDVNIINTLANGKSKDVTVLRLAEFIPSGSYYRYVILTRAAGEVEFQVISEGLATNDMLSLVFPDS